MESKIDLNPNLNINALKESFKNDNMIVIPNFLTNDYALMIEKSLKEIEDSKWNISIHPYQNGVYTFHQTDENKDFIEKGKISSQEGLAKGEFSYLFYRNDGDGTINIIEYFRTFIKSDKILALLSQIVQIDLKSTISIFASKYGPGCFLTTHTDTGRGIVAFVYNATKNWRPQYGGCFQILDWDYNKVKKTIVPEFNTFVMLNVQDNGIPHQVTPVIPNAKNDRIAIAGWLNK